ncbi:MAG: YjjG family noncanonical pyrimidine nucleotidase [Cytophagaceae bacterium]
MKNYKHIFFDLDHTLWDFEKNCTETLQELYDLHRMSEFQSFSVQDFIKEYLFVNDSMWKDFNAGLLTKKDIRDLRFKYTFERLGVEEKHIPMTINEEFLRLCPAKGHLLPYAHDVLSYLHKKYILHILTNGFTETQHIKISTSNLRIYFNEIIHSEHVGYPKPDKRIFEFAINKAKAGSCEDCIMIGDDLEADILGARNAGMDHIFLNRKNLKHSEEVMFEIKCLSELYKIL